MSPDVVTDFWNNALAGAVMTALVLGVIGGLVAANWRGPNRPA